jgi:hypothetical protein
MPLHWHGFRYWQPTEMDDMPLDFTQYLSERLGLSSSETNSILATWLRQYEPLCVGADERSSAASCPLASTSAPAPEVRQSA